MISLILFLLIIPMSHFSFYIHYYRIIFW